MPKIEVLEDGLPMSRPDGDDVMIPEPVNYYQLVLWVLRHKCTAEQRKRAYSHLRVMNDMGGEGLREWKAANAGAGS